MQKLKTVFIAMLIMASFSVIGVVNADTTPETNAQIAQSELSQTLNWPEAGLTMPYPGDWQLVSDPDFDFVLVGPEHAEGGITYITMQSGGFDAQTENVRDILLSFNGVTEESLTEVDLGGTQGYRFDSVDASIGSMFIGFTPDNSKIYLLGMTATDGLWDSWESVYESIVADIAVETLTLDSELLNQQMQANFEASGRLMVGEADAGLQVYEFLDFACPHCVDYHGTINRLVQDYVMTERANVQFGLLTFVGDDLSVNAAAVQLCGARLGVGWDVHNIIFAEYEANGIAGYDIGNLLAAVEVAELGVDSEEFATCVNDSEMVDAFLALSSTESAAYGVSGTPSILYAAGDDAFAFLMSPTGEPITRTNLLFTYEYLEELDGSTATE